MKTTNGVVIRYDAHTDDTPWAFRGRRTRALWHRRVWQERAAYAVLALGIAVTLWLLGVGLWWAWQLLQEATRDFIQAMGGTW